MTDTDDYLLTIYIYHAVHTILAKSYNANSSQTEKRLLHHESIFVDVTAVFMYILFFKDYTFFQVESTQ